MSMTTNQHEEGLKLGRSGDGGGDVEECKMEKRRVEEKAKSACGRVLGVLCL